MKRRTDMLGPASPPGIEVVQFTTEEGVPSSHIYMEAQIFAPDSKRFLVHRSAHPHGSDQRDPEHRYLVCDAADGFSLSPLTTETGATAPSVSPDGEWVYYFVNQTEIGGGRLTLKRVDLEGRDRQTVMVLDAPLPGTPYRPSRIYPLSTISSDGHKLALSCFLGDGRAETATYGLMVFDLQQAAVELVLQGPSWCNIHPQYSRSTDPQERRDILVQENHGNTHNAQGQVDKLTGGAGADIHVIRDDGTKMRVMPWGRDGNEFCQGHQCWRGRSAWAITSTGTRDVNEQQLIESRPVAGTGHLGLRTPGGIRNHLTREFDGPCFYHFGTDIRGRRLITDAGPRETGGGVYAGNLGRPGEDPLDEFTFLVNPGSSWSKMAHIHPFLSPDGSMGFFNSDESGTLQAYGILGLDSVWDEGPES